MEIKEKLLNFVKFSGVSASSTLLEYILFYFLSSFSNHFSKPALADGIFTALCYVLAAIYCFVLNKFLVFRSSKNSFSQALKFFAVAAPKLLITTFAVPALIAVFKTDSSLIKTLINVCVQTVLFFAGYSFQRLWVFKEKKD